MKKIMATVLSMCIAGTGIPAVCATAEEEPFVPQSPYYEVIKNETTKTEPDKNTSSMVYKSYVGEGRYIVDDITAQTTVLTDEAGNVLRDLTGSRGCDRNGFGGDFMEGLLVRFYEDNTADIEKDENGKNVYVYNDTYDYINTDGSVAFTYTDTERRSSKRPTGGNGGGFAVAGFLEGDKAIYYSSDLVAFHDGFAAFHSFEHDGYGIMDKTGKPINKEYYYEVLPFAGRGTVVKKPIEGSDKYVPDCLYGLIDTNGEYILPCEYSTIQAMDENWFNVDGKLYYLNENNELELKFSLDDIKAGKDCPHTFFYAGEGVIADCVTKGYLPYRYSYFYDMETKELLIPDAYQKFIYNSSFTPYLSEGWNHLESETSANYYNSKGEKLVDTDKAVMFWDKSKNYYVLRETNEDKTYSYDIVNSKLETVVEGGMFMSGNRFIASDDKGFYAASFSDPDTRKYLPYDSIVMLTAYPWGVYTDIENYNDLFRVSTKSENKLIDNGVIDIEGNLLIENKYENISFFYQNGILNAYTRYWDNETHGFVEPYNDYFILKAKKPETKPGDINGDGIVNPVDASKILVKFAELSAPDAEAVTPETIAQYDINGDGVISAVDASLVLAYCAELAGDENLTLEAFLEKRKK